MKVSEVIDHNPNVRELLIETVEPSDFKFKAGQFVMLHVPSTQPATLRAYSIASDEKRKNGFILLFKKVEGGIASTYVWKLKAGEELLFTGPFGRVFFHEPPTPQIIFLNTGTGISQHYSYLVSKMAQYPELRYRLLFGVRNENEIYYQKELEALKKNLKDFDYSYVLSRPTDSWTGKKGYVQNFIKDFDYHSIPTTFYLCGNGGMIKDVKAQLIEKEAFDKGRIFSEAFD
jgi:NAD(P)H-flavin reductase